MSEKKRARFTPKFDIALLQEVIAQNPFAQKNSKTKWIQIVAKINALLLETRNDIVFTERGCKDRLRILVNAFKKEPLTSVKASGTEEEYTERDQLLPEVIELLGEKENTLKEMERKEQEKEEQGVDIRGISMVKLSKKRGNCSEADSDGVSPPLQKEKLVQSYIEYMREKDEADRTQKEAELALKREKLQLEMKREEQIESWENLMLDLLTTLLEKLY